MVPHPSHHDYVSVDNPRQGNPFGLERHAPYKIGRVTPGSTSDPPSLLGGLRQKESRSNFEIFCGPGEICVSLYRFLRPDPKIGNVRVRRGRRQRGRSRRRGQRRRTRPTPTRMVSQDSKGVGTGRRTTGVDEEMTSLLRIEVDWERDLLS